MAEVILNAVLGKLAKFTFEKAVEKIQSLYKIREEVESLRRELNYIRAFIEDADEKHIVDKRQMVWMKDVMDVAYQIEDAVDIFLSECPETPLEEGREEPLSIMDQLKGLTRKTTQIPFLCNFEAEIKGIRHRIREIEDYRNRYEINVVGENIGGQNKKQKLDPVHKLDPVSDPEIVGFARDVDNIVKCLLDEENRSRAVVSVVGQGGLGKTTLVQKVCNSKDVKKHFDCSIWITISQKYDLLGILGKIAQKLNIKSTYLVENMLATQIWESLLITRYLIIFDDVWTEELWDEITKVLPDIRNGSRVLITTRLENIALAADTSYPPYKLPLLDDEESLKLFLKKAVPKNHEYPDPSNELYSLAKKFSIKCKGLPLALVVLGRLLSTRPYNFHEWKKLLETMSWQVDGTKCIDIIATSYEYLPLAKKLCFLYFAAFPQDHEIDAEALLRIWVAERLIPHEEGRTLEETAECFLEDLVQRSMVQVRARFSYGSIKYCVMHDILRDLAIQKAEEMNFLIVCANPNDRERCSKARRVAFHYSLDGNESLDDYASLNIRSLFTFGWPRSPPKLDYSKYRVLRVLANFEGNVELPCFRGSSHLRYLQLGSCIEGKECEFGGWIRDMKYLETLDLRSSKFNDLPNWIWQPKTLRHALLCPSPYFKKKIQGPFSSVDLKNLQTLFGVIWNESWATSGYPNLSKVRKLDIEIDGKINAREVATFLLRLKHVVVLFMRGVIDLQQLSTGGCPFSENLKSLFLISPRDGDSYDILPFRLDDDMLPPYLTQLIFEGYEFESDPMPVLEKLRCLNYLRICGTGRENENAVRRIRCSTGGFKQLELLQLIKIVPLEEWEIEVGSMPMLKELVVYGCDLLKVPLSLIHLRSLQVLDWPSEMLIPAVIIK
ncbi:hypothetical protein LUZ61_009527 [Rhynchospora tenuis]|uniref:Uncharacterized protein n=1 Tax=Rhynchospora tenuis TaxID=198213 RepID=A0AAD6EYE2_9POAL|nr:hypothetical protein LUZ61_009527 [Rhynchospora tenuis]